jgi:hypothetical protein
VVQKKKTLTGREAIKYARGHGLTLSSKCLTIAEAEDVAREDPSLIYLTLTTTRRKRKKTRRKRKKTTPSPLSMDEQIALARKALK